jgi:hypothetical protein
MGRPTKLTSVWQLCRPSPSWWKIERGTVSEGGIPGEQAVGTDDRSARGRRRSWRPIKTRGMKVGEGDGFGGWYLGSAGDSRGYRHKDVRPAGECRRTSGHQAESELRASREGAGFAGWYLLSPRNVDTPARGCVYYCVRLETATTFGMPPWRNGIRGRLRACARKGVVVRVHSGAPAEGRGRAWAVPRTSRCFQGRLAQPAERLVYTEKVGGSSPSPPTINTNTKGVRPAAVGRPSCLLRSCAAYLTAG